MLELPEQSAPVEEESRRHQTEVAYWSYCVPCAGVRYYAYEDRAVPIKTASPREASLQNDSAGSA